MIYSEQDIKVGDELLRYDNIYTILKVENDTVLFKDLQYTHGSVHKWNISHLIDDIARKWFTFKPKTQDYEIF